jgi:hypothetical protein
MPFPQNNTIQSSNPEFQPFLDHVSNHYNKILEERFDTLTPGKYVDAGFGIYNGAVDLFSRASYAKNTGQSNNIALENAKTYKTALPEIVENIFNLDNIITDNIDSFTLATSPQEISKQIEEFISKNSEEIGTINYNLRNLRGVLNEETMLTNSEFNTEHDGFTAVSNALTQAIFDRVMVEQTVNLFKKINDGSFDTSENSLDRKALEYCFKCGLDSSGNVTGQSQAHGIVLDIDRHSVVEGNEYQYPPTLTDKILTDMSSQMVQAAIDGKPVTNL